jgi:hypothetical protein
MNAPGIKMPLSFLGLVSRDTHVGPLPVSAARSLFLTVESARMGYRDDRELRLYGASLTCRRAGMSGRTSLPAFGGPAPMAKSARLFCQLRRPAQVRASLGCIAAQSDILAECAGQRPRKAGKLRHRCCASGALPMVAGVRAAPTTNTTPQRRVVQAPAGPSSATTRNTLATPKEQRGWTGPTYLSPDTWEVLGVRLSGVVGRDRGPSLRRAPDASMPAGTRPATCSGRHLDAHCDGGVEAAPRLQTRIAATRQAHCAPVRIAHRPVGPSG